MTDSNKEPTKLATAILRLRRLLLLDTASFSLPKRIVFTLMRWVSHLGRQISKDRCPEKAASLAYTTILTLIPILALVVSYLKWMGTLDSLSETLQTWVYQTLVVEVAQDAVMVIDSAVSRVDPNTLGFFGLIGLLFSAYILIRAIERAVNDIWGISTHRSFLRKARMLFISVFVAPLFLMASIYVWGRAQELKLFGIVDESTWMMQIIHLVGPYLLSIPPFFLLLKVIPNTHVHWRPALIAALISGFLFELAKYGFGYYVTNIMPISQIYGSLGLFPVFLIWLFLSWLIFLIGADIAYTSQNLKKLHLEYLEQWTD